MPWLQWLPPPHSTSTTAATLHERFGRRPCAPLWVAQITIVWVPSDSENVAEPSAVFVRPSNVHPAAPDAIVPIATSAPPSMLAVSSAESAAAVDVTVKSTLTAALSPSSSHTNAVSSIETDRRVPLSSAPVLTPCAVVPYS